MGPPSQTAGVGTVRSHETTSEVVQRLGREWVPGAVSGSIQVLLGHPLDTIKTRSQGLNYASSRNTAALLFKEGGVTAFYRGVVPPVLLTASKRGLQLLLWERLTPLLHGNTFLAGAVTGGLGTLVSCPLHVVKITAQTSPNAKTSLTAARHVYTTKGVIGYYRGFPLHLARDSCFASAYLGMYGYLRGALPSEMPGRIVVAAVVSSLLTWGLLQPFDTLKTMAQLGMPWHQVLRNAVSGDRAAMRGSLSRSWRGVGAAMMRAGPVNALSMSGYEYAKAALR